MKWNKSAATTVLYDVPVFKSSRKLDLGIVETADRFSKQK
jgi:hypothetical protein